MRPRDRPVRHLSGDSCVRGGVGVVEMGDVVCGGEENVVGEMCGVVFGGGVEGESCGA